MITFETVYRVSLIGTFFVLLWYTIETARIRKINTEQKDLQLLPAMMLYIRGDEDKDNLRLAMRNIGFGTATGVQIEPTTFTVDGKEIVFKFRLADQNNTLVANEEREVEIEVHKNGQSSYHNRYSEFMAYFSPENLDMVTHFKEAKMVRDDTPEASDIHITFKDINAQGYKTTIGFRPEGIVVLLAPERVKNDDRQTKTTKS
jgi:hypothetical protein